MPGGKKTKKKKPKFLPLCASGTTPKHESCLAWILAPNALGGDGDDDSDDGEIESTQKFDGAHDYVFKI